MIIPLLKKIYKFGVSKDKGYYKGQIGLNDIKIFVLEAKKIPMEIEILFIRQLGYNNAHKMIFLLLTQEDKK